MVNKGKVVRVTPRFLASVAGQIILMFTGGAQGEEHLEGWRWMMTVSPGNVLHWVRGG